MYYKKLSGKKCYLSPINNEDYQKYTEWLNDLEVLDNLSISSLNINESSEKEALYSSQLEYNKIIQRTQLCNYRCRNKFINWKLWTNGLG